jgi:hypothetical protein
MPQISIRWSEHEAGKPYARPFAVRFHEREAMLGAVATSGADLLYYRQFQLSVLSLCGELFRDPAIESHADPQRAWLDRLGELLPPAPEALRLRPASTFDHDRGRTFHIEADGLPTSVHLPTASLIDYQEFQATIAHKGGCLFRARQVEDEEEPSRRQALWLDVLETILERPQAADLMAESWPWRSAIPD